MSEEITFEEAKQAFIDEIRLIQEEGTINQEGSFILQGRLPVMFGLIEEITRQATLKEVLEALPEEKETYTNHIRDRDEATGHNALLNQIKDILTSKMVKGENGTPDHIMKGNQS